MKYRIGETVHCQKLGAGYLCEIVGTEPGERGGWMYHVRELGWRERPIQPTIMVAEDELKKLEED